MIKILNRSRLWWLVLCVNVVGPWGAQIFQPIDLWGYLCEMSIASVDRVKQMPSPVWVVSGKRAILPWPKEQTVGKGESAPSASLSLSQDICLLLASDGNPSQTASLGLQPADPPQSCEPIPLIILFIYVCMCIYATAFVSLQNADSYKNQKDGKMADYR